MADHVNLVKLCVGAEKVDDLIAAQAKRRRSNGDGLPRHVTRRWPKRAAELVQGGSLYWVFKGAILARQEIVRLDEVPGGDGIARCGIVLAQQVVRTAAMPKRPFQGWRYLAPEHSPPDLPEGRATEEDLPPRLVEALEEMGVR